MESPYHPEKIEREAQEHWERTRSFRAIEECPGESVRPKFYCLSMFPYPSGKLHMGHVRNYTIGDVMTRFHRMRGFNVLQPMGWDAFGLPAENAAMANGVPPAKWTYDNIAYMKKQLQSLGFAIDWERELATCRPEYYRWNQWLFLRMLEKGLVYKKTGIVNWDPVDQTVLANEQVIDGRGWRTGAVVEKREIPMYYMRITAHAQELLDALDSLPGWPERVKTMQANWIGRSEGVEIVFPAGNTQQGIRVFTTRADTLFGATFVAVAAEHPIARHAAASDAKLAAFIEECRRGAVMEAELATLEKKGMDTGLFVLHPFTGEQLPVWVANYVLMAYGEGAVMVVPAHDQRDFEMATLYGLPIKWVVKPPGGELKIPATEAYVEHGLTFDSGEFSGLPFDRAVDAIAAALERKGLGRKRVQWRLRDWGISRQRYWGTPIPLVHCETCGDVPVPDEALPVVLPENLVPDGTGNPLAKTPAFYECRCPGCAKPARRETDTMDTFVDSSWYFFRFACPDASSMIDARATHWLPVDQYVGGIEHAIMHLLYSRFWTKVMRDLGLTSIDEPFTNLLTQGMVLNDIYLRRSEDGRITYYNPSEVEVKADEKGQLVAASLRGDGEPVESGGIGTMSKSKNNGVDPQVLVDQYGADTARLFMMFASPPEQTLEWSESGVEGAYRFLRRLWTFAHQRQGALREQSSRRGGNGITYEYPENLRDIQPQLAALRREIHGFLSQASYDMERKQFNTVASAAMKILNALHDHLGFQPAQDNAQSNPAASIMAPQVLHESISILLRVISPITPHIAHALWVELGFKGDLIGAPWPELDAAALEQEEIELVLQVNGKLRGHMRAPKSAGKVELEQLALGSEAVRKYTGGQAVKKVVVVPGRLVNVVV